MVHDATEEVIREVFSREGELTGPDKVAGFSWRATELAQADEVVRMTMACRNIDSDTKGWFALLVDSQRGDKHHVGRGSTAWEAVKRAHELQRIFSARYDDRHP